MTDKRPITIHLSDDSRISVELVDRELGASIPVGPQKYEISWEQDEDEYDPQYAGPWPVILTGDLVKQMCQEIIKYVDGAEGDSFV